MLVCSRFLMRLRAFNSNFLVLTTSVHRGWLLTGASPSGTSSSGANKPLDLCKAFNGDKIRAQFMLQHLLRQLHRQLSTDLGSSLIRRVDQGKLLAHCSSKVGAKKGRSRVHRLWLAGMQNPLHRQTAESPQAVSFKQARAALSELQD